jgi:hypothetical protein
MAPHLRHSGVYGYDNVDVAGADGRRLHVVRRVNAEQAAVVRRISALCAEGQGFTPDREGAERGRGRAAAAGERLGAHRDPRDSPPAALSRRGDLEPHSEARPMGAEEVPTVPTRSSTS